MPPLALWRNACPREAAAAAFRMHAAAVLSTSIYSFHLTRRGCATYLFCSFCVCCERRRVRESARSSWINLRKTRCRFCIFLSLCCCNARAAFTSMPYTVLYINICARSRRRTALGIITWRRRTFLNLIWMEWPNRTRSPYYVTSGAIDYVAKRVAAFKCVHLLTF